MKGFGIYVKNDLLEPKHYKNMGEAVWIYMWLLDKVTSVNENGQGKVLGGKPITYAEIQTDLGIHQNTYTNHLNKLREHGYVNTLRTPRGLVILVNKSAKRFTKTSDSQDRVIHKDRGSDSQDIVNAEDSQNMDIQYKTNQSRLTNTTKKATNVASQSASDDVQKVFDFYVKSFESPNTKLSTQRKLKLKARIKDAGLPMLERAITNTANSSFHRGDNDRAWKADIDFIIRNYEQVEKLAAMVPAGITEAKFTKEEIAKYV